MIFGIELSMVNGKGGYYIDMCLIEFRRESFFSSFSGYRPAQWGCRGMNGTYRSQSRCPPLPTQSHNLLWIDTNDGKCWPAIVTLHSMVLLCPKEVKPQGSVEKLSLWFSILIQRLVKKGCRCESKVSYFPQFIFTDPKI